MHILKYYVKRCVGLPGDTLSIENGIFKIKGYEGIVGNYISQEAISKRKNETFEKEVLRCFPYDTIFDWNIKTFGPLYIPKAGDSNFQKIITLWQGITGKTLKIPAIGDFCQRNISWAKLGSYGNQ